LFFLRQKKDPGLYFNTMLVFFTLSYFSNILMLADPSLDYPYSAFYVVTIVLISLNSIRVAWIAFLTKKQKYYLLGLSIVLSVVYGLAFSLLFYSEIVKQMIYTFSPGLHTVFSLVMIYGSIYFGVIFFVTLFHLPTAEAFDRKAQEVTSMMDITKLITQVFDFKELADTITLMTTQACNSDSAWLVTNSKNGIELNSVHKIGYVDANNVSNRLLGSGDVSFERIEVIDHSSLFSDLKFTDHHFHSVAVAPLTMHGKINGYLFTARAKGNTFDTEDRKSLQAFAYYAAVALENAMLIKESIEKERLEKELDVARDIQRKILPAEVPSSQNLAVSALFVPAFEVGGDYYDFFELDAENLGFVVADVSGKGISSAFIMAEVKGIFESLSKIVQKPDELLIKVNDVLKGNLEKKNFVTAVYGVINKRSGLLKMSRAGHTPSLLCTEGKVERLQPPGIGLGLDFNNNFVKSIKEMEIQLKNNDIVVCYSDGIPEAKNSAGEDFGYERFERIISENCGKTLDEISNLVMRELSLFSKDHSQHDDITLVLFKWKQKQ
jgi:serine phosphatase RsbU (regulator of sigma subunit)